MGTERSSPPAEAHANASLFVHAQTYLGRALISLKFRDFRYLALSSLALGFGQWFQTVALGWLAFEITGSAIQLAVVGSIRGVVVVGITPIGGFLADRFNRRNVIAWTTGLACVQALALAWLVFSGLAEIWHLYFFALLEGTAAATYQPSRQALVFNVVPRESLPNAVAMNSISQNLARVSGPAAAGMLIGFGGSGAAFFALGVVKLFAAGVTLFIRGTVTPQTVTTRGQSPFRSVWEGLQYAFSNRTILALLIVAGIGPMIVWPYLQMLPVFVEILGRGPSAYGVLATAAGWGSLIGLAALISVGDIQRRGRVVLVMQLTYIFLVAAFAQSRGFELSLALLFAAGIFLVVSTTLTNTLFQIVVTDEYRGRVMSLYTMSTGFQFIGALPMGLAISTWGAPAGVTLFMVVGGITTLAVAILSPALRRA